MDSKTQAKKQKILRFEEFLSDKLQPDLRAVLEDRDKVYADMAEFAKLKSMIALIADFGGSSFSKRTGRSDLDDSYKTLVDVGCDFFMQAKVYDPALSLISILVGLDCYVEFTFDEALTFIERREKQLTTKADGLTERALELKSQVKLVLAAIQEVLESPQVNINSLPVELVAEILSWIPPLLVMRYRSTSHLLNECLTSQWFARMNLDRHLHLVNLSAEVVYRAEDLDKMLSGFPEHYQCIYLSRKFARTLKISWKYIEFWNSKIPQTLARVESLEVLELSYCQLECGLGPYVDAASPITQLKELLLQCNSLSGFIPDLSPLMSLEKLNLMFNQLCGPIPESIGCLINLKILYLNGNSLSGSLPECLGNLTKLEELYLNRNELTGPIPTSIGGLQCLKKLNMSKNRLCGCIPVELCTLKSLREIDISMNKLTGSIPDEITAMPHLKDVILSQNNITGTIPGSFGSSTVENLYLSENMISGNIPNDFGSWQSLRRLRVNDNKLVGRFPTEIATLPFLKEIWTFGNAISLDSEPSIRDGVDAMFTFLPLHE
ncbi:hypothetical protein HDU84_001471 [Entophlyctis sp. JEL0112]|nr:hypothetical protein HDU84_001471 [Entophlyctis sp. JEL0112]